MSEWRPIETAPKDGTQVLFYGKWRPYDILPGGGDCIIIASWSTFMSDNTGYHWITGFGAVESINVCFTHWQPLPEPPHDPPEGRRGSA